MGLEASWLDCVPILFIMTRVLLCFERKWLHVLTLAVKMDRVVIGKWEANLENFNKDARGAWKG